MKTSLITPQGYENLKQELDHLWRIERPEVTKKVSWAASLGDRSENADYKYNKKRLREIDRRVRYLRKCLENLQIVEYRCEQEGKVFFGAWVSVEKAAEKTTKKATKMHNEKNNREHDAVEILKFRIVGYDEIFNRKDYISIDSPMARALLKKQVDDEAVVTTQAGTSIWYINEIEYEK